MTYFDYLWYGYRIQSKCRYKGVECYVNYLDNVLFRNGDEKIPLLTGVFITKNLDVVSERSSGVVYDIFKRYNLEVSKILLNLTD